MDVSALEGGGGNVRGAVRGRRLPVGPTRTTWTLIGLYCASMLAMAAWLCWAAAMIATLRITLVWGTLAVAPLVGAFHAVVTTYEGAHWLDGTVLVGRRLGRWARCDLSRASVSLQRGPTLLAGLRLMATEANAPPLVMRLRPHAELNELAEAIMSGRANGHVQAEAVAAELRRLSTWTPA